MMSQPLDHVWVIATQNEDGLGVSAHETEELAIADLFREVSACWSTYIPDREMPSDPREAIEEFYEETCVCAEKWYTIQQVPIDRGKPNA
jgi:hypothetical protein